MPVDPVTGQLRAFTADEIAAMNIRTAGVRDRTHGAETREIGQSTMRKSFWVNWASRYDFLELVFGTEKLWNDGGTTRLSRLLPDDIYGRNPDKPEIVATKLTDMRGDLGPGVDDADGVVEYPDALCSIDYEHVPYNLAEDADVYLGNGERDRYLWYTDSDGDAEEYQLPGGAMKYWRDPAGPNPTDPPNGQPVPVGVRIIRPVETFTYTHERLPYEAFTVGSPIFERVYGTVEGDLSYLGCVNTAEFLGRPIGTVVYGKCKASLLRAHTAEGYRWRLAHTFYFAPLGHTWLYYPDPTGTNAGFYMVSNTGFSFADSLGDFQSIVPGARDLNDLFNVN